MTWDGQRWSIYCFLLQNLVAIQQPRRKNGLGGTRTTSCCLGCTRQSASDAALSCTCIHIVTWNYSIDTFLSKPCGKERRYCFLSSFKVAQCIGFIERILQAYKAAYNFVQISSHLKGSCSASNTHFPIWMTSRRWLASTTSLSQNSLVIAPLDMISLTLLIRQFFSLAVRLRALVVCAFLIWTYTGILQKIVAISPP